MRRDVASIVPPVIVLVYTFGVTIVALGGSHWGWPPDFRLGSPLTTAALC